MAREGSILYLGYADQEWIGSERIYGTVWDYRRTGTDLLADGMKKDKV